MLGLYISVPFCRTKCSFCNFASGVFSRELFDRYVQHVTAEIVRADALACEMGGNFERAVDSIYLGGGTPSVLAPGQLRSLFTAMRDNFDVAFGSEVTVECAPGTLSPEFIDTLVACGVNRVSLGVQSFVDQESRSVGRLHTRAITLDDIARLRATGITEISIDLIAGLPHQTADSWRYSLEETIATEVPHISVYMLEVDEDSRLGRELIAGGARYHAHFVPDDDTTADLYIFACETLDRAGVHQYEISNFARGPLDTRALPHHASRHNLKYWLRQPYLGFGVDAHSMLAAPKPGEPHAAVRFATSDSLDVLLGAPPSPGAPRSVRRSQTDEANVGSVETFAPRTRTEVAERNAIEEAWFLGLRLNRGIDLTALAEEFGIDAIELYRAEIMELNEAALIEIDGGHLRLTPRGRLLSNEVFSRFIEEDARPQTPDASTNRSPLPVLRSPSESD